MIPTEKRGMGMVYQSYALWPHLTVFENVAYPLHIRKISNDEINKRVKDCLLYTSPGPRDGLLSRMPSSA